MTAPRMRASDADRQRTVDRLAHHFTAGRLTAAEYDERVRQAYAATYLDELPVLTADLPEDRRGFADASGRGGDESGWGGGDPGWYGPPGWRGRNSGQDAHDRWYGRAGFTRRHGSVAVLPLIIGVVLLIGLTHGFILIPVVWIVLALLLFRRHRHGGCRSHIGPRSAP